MTYQIKIELLSDLCSGNGATRGRFIDTDICQDKDGFPYIPGKRLKGILLQGYLDYVDIMGKEDDSGFIFGEEDGEETKFYVSDALLNEEETIRKIPKSYIYERTQTRVNSETGIAEEGSLRTLAVCKKGTNFTFTLTCNLKEDILNAFLPLVTSTGIHRNRGLGKIKLTLVKKIENKASSTEKLEGLNDLDDENECCYSIIVKAKNNILLPQENENITGDAIPGSSLYGFFAYHYIHTHNISNPLSDPTFCNIFYRKGLKFSFGYISGTNDGNEYKDYYPLPSCIQKAKNRDEFRLLFASDYDNDTKQDTPQFKYKALKDQYGEFDLNSKTIFIKNITHSFEYHHSRDKDNMGKGLVEENNFFQYESITKGQYFRFDITGKGKYLKKILENISDIHVGRSRTAQYGTLEIIKGKKIENKNCKGEYYLAIITSPLIIKQNNDEKYPDYSSVLKEIQGKYPMLQRCDFQDKSPYYRFTKKLISGFNMTWKKCKPSYYAIAPGSYLILKRTAKGIIRRNLTIGQNQEQGYGRIRFIGLQKIENSIPLKHLSEDTEEKKIDNYKDSMIYLALQEKNKAIDKFNSQKRNYAYLSRGLISRMIQMLKDTKDYQSFENKVRSIKDEKMRKDGLELLKNYEGTKDKKFYFYYFFTILTLIKYEQRKEVQE